MTQAPGPQFPVDYAGPQTRYTFRPLRGRAKAAIICISVVMVMNLLYAGLSFLGGPLAEMVERDDPAEASSLLLIAGGIMAACCLNLLAVGLAATFHSMWIYRASQCAHAIMPHMEFTPGWAVGWFFIPLLNLVRPYHVAKELWQVSMFDAATNVDYRQVPVPGSVLGWWLCYVFGRIISSIGDRMSGVKEVALAGAVLDVVGALLVAVAGVLCIQMIRGITENLESKNPNPA